jgi:hypothetical protein
MSVLPALSQRFSKPLIGFIATVATATITPAVQASTTLPMSLLFDEGVMQMVVPDTDTTKSAYGGTLRVYDVHVAKMFEVTNAWCQSGTVGGGITWTYWAGGGIINMGQFSISCRLAADIATAYGLGNDEQTLVRRAGGEGYSGRTERWNIPILNITGGKVERWMSFVEQFHPQF